MKKLIGSSVLIIGLMGFQTITKKQTLTKPKPAAISPAMLQASVERGKLVYLQVCLACHQVDGGGVPHMNAPLDGATAVVGKDKAKLIRIVLKGMTDRVEIDGEFYSNNMAPHSDLSDQQIADVLTYVRNSWTNKASHITSAEVKRVRATIK